MGMEVGGIEPSEPQPETEEAIRQRFVEELRQGYAGRALALKEEHNFPQEFLESPEVQEAAERGLARLVHDLHGGGGEMWAPVGMMKDFVTSKEKVVEIAEAEVLSSLRNDFMDLQKLRVVLGEEIIGAVKKSPQVQEAVKQALVRSIDRGLGYSDFFIMEALREFDWSMGDIARFKKKAKGGLWLSWLKGKK